MGRQISKYLYFFASILLVLLIVIIYWPVTRTFYQQDEWLGYGLFLAKGAGTVLQSTGSFWGIIFGQGRIMSNLLFYFFYKIWPLNVFPVAVFSISLHIVNTLLIFYIAKRIFKNVLSAFLGALFFAVNSVPQSAITWAASSTNTPTSTTLILVSILFYFIYLEKNKTKWLFYSFILIYVSLFFKETGIFLFLLLPVSALIFKKYSFKSFIKTFWYYFVAVTIIVAYRLLGFLFTPQPEALFLTGSSKYFFDSLIIRSVLYPLTSFSLTIIPSSPFVWFARYIESVYYPFFPSEQFILIAQSVVLDLVSTVFSFALFILIYVIAKKTEIKQRKVIIFLVSLLLFNFLPYIIISKNYSYLESRYYYLASAIWGIIIAWVFSFVFEKRRHILIKIAAILLFLYLIYAHISALSADIANLAAESQTRIRILDQITKLESNLAGNKNVFYVTGNADYLLPGNNVPFQQGFGYTLMTIYYKSGKIPATFFLDQYLFEIGSQGYKEESGYGFGYFSDKSLMGEVLKRKDISIAGFYYDSKEGVVRKLDPSSLAR